MPGRRNIRIKPFGHRLAERFCGMSRGILRVANRGLPRFSFMKAACDLLIDFSQADSVELRSQEGAGNYVCGLRKGENHTIYQGDDPQSTALSTLERFCLDVQTGRCSSEGGCFSRNGGFSIIDEEMAAIAREGAWSQAVFELTENGAYPSIALLPFEIDDQNSGSLVLKSGRPGFFTVDEIQFYEGLAQSLGAAVADRRAQESLRARMKELDCLYAVTRELSSGNGLATLHVVADILSGAWVWPEATVARIELDDCLYGPAENGRGGDVLEVPLQVSGVSRGRVVITFPRDYFRQMEDSFYLAEQQLLGTVGRKIADFVEQLDAVRERGQLTEQLMHADRLATIGQLAAGVAHELNEPLGNILGFAQLSLKEEGVPPQIRDDLGRIVKASLHAREVIRKLMIFARRTPTRSEPVNLNRVVEEGLSFLEARCVKSEIVLKVVPGQPDPWLLADPSQLLQVLVNLVVNGIQAMPEGGRLSVKTFTDDRDVRLVVEDNGMGMSADVQKKVFLPFFTTKDIDSGTGLGLAVVHGIVTAHGGHIILKSGPGEGSRFDVVFPRWEGEME